MKWFRIVMKIIVATVLLGYIIFAFLKEKDWTNTKPCERLAICIKDSSLANFVSENDVLTILDNHHLNPMGVPMANVNSHSIEQALATHQFILESQCYKTADNVVHVDVLQRLPVMRIMSNNGDNYFIDAKGHKMPKVKYPADVVVATGSISSKYASKYLASIGSVLRNDEFWNSQVEQLNVLEDGTIEMMPRVGNHIVYFGLPTGFPNKLKKLKTFYAKVLNQVGWNKYSRINMEYGNQIICTKTE